MLYRMRTLKTVIKAQPCILFKKQHIFINSRLKSLIKAPRNPPKHLIFFSEQPSGPKNPLKRP